MAGEWLQTRSLNRDRDSSVTIRFGLQVTSQLGFHLVRLGPMKDWVDQCVNTAFTPWREALGCGWGSELRDGFYGYLVSLVTLHRFVSDVTRVSVVTRYPWRLSHTGIRGHRFSDVSTKLYVWRHKPGFPSLVRVTDDISTRWQHSDRWN